MNGQANDEEQERAKALNYYNYLTSKLVNGEATAEDRTIISKSLSGFDMNSEAYKEIFSNEQISQIQEIQSLPEAEREKYLNDGYVTTAVAAVAAAAVAYYAYKLVKKTRGGFIAPDEKIISDKFFDIILLPPEPQPSGPRPVPYIPNTIPFGKIAAPDSVPANNPITFPTVFPECSSLEKCLAPYSQQ